MEKGKDIRSDNRRVLSDSTVCSVASEETQRPSIMQRAASIRWNHSVVQNDECEHLEIYKVH